MKKIFLTGLAAVLALPVFIACNDNIPDDLSFDNYKNLWLITAGKSDKATTEIDINGAIDTVFSIAGMRYGGVQQPVGEVTASLAIDLSLVSAYNQENGTDFLPAPAGSVSLGEASLTIPGSGFISNPFTLNVKGSQMEYGKTYLVPVTLSQSNSLQIDESRKTAYVRINRNRYGRVDEIAFINANTTGWWTFDDTANLFKATVGQDITGGYGTTTYGDLDFNYTEADVCEGPSSTNGAVTLPYNSFLHVRHGITPNGGGANVNQYSMLLDYRLAGTYYIPFYNTDMTNANEADLFENGRAYTIYQDSYWYGDPVDYYNYTAAVIVLNQWQRMVVTVDLVNNTFSIYHNGQFVQTFSDATAFAIDGFQSLDPAGVLLGADGTGLTGEIDFAEVRIWNAVLTAEQVALLGTVGNVPQ
ncbi:MAG: DUF1735 and LamG domain-containing protein [Dysgonamonadaceae bacterium]|jgi:hypothetical protein|nr:DUF1735 and LamG domain-containing protein [Dysgonamonadaceae bacterium]